MIEGDRIAPEVVIVQHGRMVMKFKLLILCVAVLLSVQYNSVIASGSENVIQKLLLDAGEIYKNGNQLDFLKFRWKISKCGTVCLERLKIIKEPLRITDLTLTIPGEIDGHAAGILHEAFRGLKSDKLRLHLIFKEKNSHKVKATTNWMQMFFGSTSIRSIDFSGIESDSINDMRYCFGGCKNIQALDLRNLNMIKLREPELYNMLNGCFNLLYLNISSIRDDLKQEAILYKIFETDIGAVVPLALSGLLSKIKIITDKGSKEEPPVYREPESKSKNGNKEQNEGNENNGIDILSGNSCDASSPTNNNASSNMTTSRDAEEVPQQEKYLYNKLAKVGSSHKEANRANKGLGERGMQIKTNIGDKVKVERDAESVQQKSNKEKATTILPEAYQTNRLEKAISLNNEGKKPDKNQDKPARQLEGGVKKTGDDAKTGGAKQELNAADESKRIESRHRDGPIDGVEMYTDMKEKKYSHWYTRLWEKIARIFKRIFKRIILWR